MGTDRADRTRGWSLDAAGWTFAGLLVVAAVFFAVTGRQQWFFQDEWAFLSSRDGGSVDGLLGPHNEHWTTLPVAVYRVLWNVVGARSYRPYQAVSIGMHLVVAVLLLVLMRRRLGVRPWIATLGASLVLFYGSGAENVVWAFQISFTGALAFGLVNLLLSDHPDPSPRRRVAGLLCGLASLMCSGVGLLMLVVVAVALLARRGWRAAVVNAGPLLVIYGIWRVAFAREEGEIGSDVALIAEFAGTGVSNAIGLLGQSGIVVFGQVTVTVLGLVFVAQAARAAGRPLRKELGIPLALLAGAVGFLVLTGLSRADRFGLEFATRGRYAYVTVVLLVPLGAMGFDAVLRRWPRLLVPGVVLLLAGVPGNLSDVAIRETSTPTNSLVLAVVHSPALREAQPDTVPFPGRPGYYAITAGWLRESLDAGRMPGEPNAKADLRAEALARLTLVPGEEAPGSPRCEPLDEDGTEVLVTRDEPAIFVGLVRVQVVDPQGGRSEERNLGAFEPRLLETVGAPITVSIVPRPSELPGSLCR